MNLFFRHSSIACLAIAAVVILGGRLAVPPPAKAGTGGPVHPWVQPKPSCERRVTVTSKPCGAMIYIDGIQVGRTPMSFPMPTGRYTLVLLAPGHQRYTQRFLVPDAPLQIDAKLVPKR